MRKRISKPVMMLFVTLVAATGCEAPAPSAPEAAPQAQVTSALFEIRPDTLLSVAAKVCDAPDKTISRPSKDVVQCRMLLEPKATATAILQFDGTIEDLPQLVISLHTGKVTGAATGDPATGFVVTGCAFLRVPQKTGGIRQVVFNSRSIDSRLKQMLRAAGGRPLAQAPAGAAQKCLQR